MRSASAPAFPLLPPKAPPSPVPRFSSLFTHSTLSIQGIPRQQSIFLQASDLNCPLPTLLNNFTPASSLQHSTAQQRRATRYASTTPHRTAPTAIMARPKKDENKTIAPIAPAQQQQHQQMPLQQVQQFQPQPFANGPGPASGPAPPMPAQNKQTNNANNGMLNPQPVINIADFVRVRDSVSSGCSFPSPSPPCPSPSQAK